MLYITQLFAHFFKADVVWSTITFDAWGLIFWLGGLYMLYISALGMDEREGNIITLK
jgi:hypothetical protein